MLDDAVAQPLNDETIQEALRQAAIKLKLQETAPALYVSDEVRCPVIFCWSRRPTLLLPNRWSSRFSRPVAKRKPELQQDKPDIDDLVGILCHELAHWKRRDHWAAVIGELAAAVLPWQPLVWWAKRRLEHLSELACDHWVLASGQAAASYAESLLGLVPQRHAALALPALKHRKKLAVRIRHILQEWRCDPKPGWKWASVATVVSISFAGAMALFQAQNTVAQAAKDEGKDKSASPKAAVSAEPLPKKVELPEKVLDVTEIRFSPYTIGQKMGNGFWPR